MDTFHVVRLAGDALNQCRRRVQQATCGHRGRKGDPLYAARRTLHTDINGRLEHLRSSALGFRNLTNYIARSLLETGGSGPDYTLDLAMPGRACRSPVPSR